MKCIQKRTYCLLAVFIITMSFLALPIPVSAAVLSKDYELGWVYQYQNGGSIGDTVVVRMFLDGETVFCVEPHVGNNTGDVYNPPVPAEQYYSEAVLERLGLIAHYGYHLGDGSLLSAGFAMMMMHETVGFPITKIIDFTGGGVFTSEAYAQFQAATEGAIASYNTLPSFSGTSITLTGASPRSITDQNGVLSGYRIVSAPEGIVASLEGDELKIEADASFTGGEIILERVLSNVGVPLLFLLEGKQRLVKALVEAPRRASISLEFDPTGAFTLEKSSTEGGLVDGSHFEVRGNGETRTVLVEDGRVHVENLVAGTYDVQEVLPPFGFRIDNGVRQVEVKAGQTADAVTLNVANEPKKASVAIKKADEVGNPVQGVTFELSRQEDFQGDTITGQTDVGGLIAFPDLYLYLGETVYIREIEVPSHLTLDDTVHTVTLVDGQTHTLNVDNKFADSSVKILKKDMNDKPIEGAKFELCRLEDFSGELFEAVTNHEGEAVFSGLSIRDGETVYVRETYVPEPYIRDSTVITVRLKAGEVMPLTFQNDFAKGKIFVKKRDALDDRPLAGVSFGLFQLGEEIARAVTDDSGLASFGTFLPGEYVIRELETLPGYLPDISEHALTVRYVDDLTIPADIVLELKNKPILGRVRVSKRGDKDNEPVNGAVFVLHDEHGVEVDRFTTDETGVAVSAEHRFGRYTVSEVEAPEAYYLGKETRDIEIIEDGEIIDVSFTNERIELVLRILKHDISTLEPLGGAVFELYDKSGERLLIGEGEGEERYQVKTGSDGRAVTNLRLQAGTYRLVEVEPPPGYSRSVDQTFSVGRDTPIVELNWYGRAIEQLVGNAPTVTEFSKVDGLTGEMVEGALLLLHETESGAVVDVWYSEGKAHQVKKLVAGRSYSVSELVTPSGYAKGNDVEFTVKETDQVQSVSIVNDPITLIIDKTDSESGLRVKGALFRLLDQFGQPVSFQATEHGFRQVSEGSETIVTDGAGKLILTHLPEGQYTLLELSCPGYFNSSIRQPIRLTNRHAFTAPLRIGVENTPFEVLIRKTDQESGKTLSGATFQIRDDNGRVLQFLAEGGRFVYHAEAVSGANMLSELPVNDAGELRLSRLLPGRYELWEMTAPDGYEKGDMLPFVVNGNETERIVLEYKNRQSIVSLLPVRLPATGEAKDSLWPILGTLLLMNSVGIASIRSLRRQKKQRPSGDRR